MKTFFTDIQNIKQGDELFLDEVEHNHLSRVLRCSVGEEIELYNNTENSYICTILSITKKQTQIKVNKVIQAKTNPVSDVTVYTAMLKGEKFEFLITKFTELGIKAIVPFESEFCIGKQSVNKKDRFLQIAKDACKQCKRTKLLDVKEPITFKEMLKDIQEYDYVLFAYEKNQDGSLNKVLDKMPKNKKVALVIGSEGGFSEKEAEQIIQAGAHCVSLGNRILRAETASIMLASVVLYKLDEFDVKNS